MRNRIAQELLKKKAQESNNREYAFDLNRSKVLSIPSISQANKDYIKAQYQFFEDKNEYVLNRAKENYENALKLEGYTIQNLSYAPLCSRCNDTGKLPGKNELCTCVRDEFISLMKKECYKYRSLPISFDESFVKSLSCEEQKEAILRVHNYFNRFATAYPKTTVKNITLVGNVGCGKTCLAASLVDMILKKGYSALFLSALDFSNLCLTAHTSPMKNRTAILHDLLNTDLLVIDDLGVEPILKNVTVEYLYNVLELRMQSGKVTLFTTNLDSADILERYNERIHSRLSDKEFSIMLEIPGIDLRK